MEELYAACLTYEAGVNYTDFLKSDKPVWLMGKEYNLLNDSELKAFQDDVRSKLWFTYRRNFPTIADTSYTCDTGWGCMHRCGQMLFAEAFTRRHLKRDWIWEPGTLNAAYLKILKKFNDLEECPYSIQNIAIEGRDYHERVVGEWYGPNAVAQVLKKLTVEDKDIDFVIHIALDLQVIRADIKMQCKQNVTECASETKEHCASVQESIESGPNEGNESDSPVSCQNMKQDLDWKPLFLVIPLRLGLTSIDSSYFERLKGHFRFPESLGIIGGRTKHASYFIGYTGDQLLFLDPHTTQVHCSVIESIDETYHCSQVERMPLAILDPSIALCFYFESEQSFDNWCSEVQEQVKRDMFVIREVAVDMNDIFVGTFNCDPVSDEERIFTSDDEFEIL